MTGDLPVGRSYRSHLQPACLPYRKRKSRCKIDGPEGSKCLMCSSHEIECVYPDAPVGSTRAARSRRKRLPRLKASPIVIEDEPASDEDRSCLFRKVRRAPQSNVSTTLETNVACDKKSPEETPFSKSKLPFTSAEDESHIIGPTSSPDVRLVADYLSNSASGNVPPLWVTRSFRPNLMAGQQPVVFGAVHRRPLGINASQTIASSRCEIIEKLLDPFCTELIDLYFKKINTCLPLLDEPMCRDHLVSEKNDVAPALRACLLANTMVFWKQSRNRSDQHCPDIRFVWNQANEALYSEMHLSPGMPTLSAILLYIAGRPLTCMIGNGILLGSAISLAHTLGLHHDCQNEDIPLAEKRSRTRIWWVMVVLDKWSSVAYGKPPQLRRTQHNAPSPSLADLVEASEDYLESKMSTAFPALTTLTEILDTYLEYVFNLRAAVDYPYSLEKPDLDRRLRAWEDSLPGGLRRAMLRADDLHIPSSPNLRLAYLYIKFLSQKVQLRGTGHRRSSTASAADAHSQGSHLPALGAAEEIVRFIQDLDEQTLSDFWLPPIVFTLSDTVVFLLGCAVQQENEPTTVLSSNPSFQLAYDMITALQSHQTRFGWDIGAVCLAQYAKTVEQVVSLDASGPAGVMPHLEWEADGLTFSNFDEPLPDLWEWFEGM